MVLERRSLVALGSGSLTIHRFATKFNALIAESGLMKGNSATLNYDGFVDLVHSTEENK